tara:strand:- start:16124 stop:16873 length:750 start_codon:yes stop_codon:yes gene_type:complete
MLNERAETRRLPVYDYSGRVAVVTGGSRGMGRAIAQRLEDSGAEVWIIDRNPQEGRPRQLQADVTLASELNKAADLIVSESGRVDIVVHNAGLAGPTGPLVESDPDLWRGVVDVNLVGTYEVNRCFVPLLLRQTHSWLVNMASLAGKEGTPNASAYSASKAGVIAMTKSLAKEHAATGLRINALAPAAIETELLQQMSQTHVDTMIAKSPQGRLGQPGEVAEVVAWLVSDACTFNTGAIFDLSGGRAVY